MKKINNPNDLVIVSAVRTPFGRFGGVLKEIHSSALGTLVIKEVLSRTELDGNAIDELYCSTISVSKYGKPKLGRQIGQR